MLLTRKQFGISMLLGLGSIFLFRIANALGFLRHTNATPTRAMFWRSGDKLAG
ncbi:MAG: hypothetical protein WC683_14175 [bacterium]